MDHSARLSILIVGGGVAALEALLALSHLAGDRVVITAVAPEVDFVLKPLTVAEPFGGGPAERHALAAAIEAQGAQFIQGRLAEVRSEEHLAVLDDGRELSYQALILALGGRPQPAFSDAITFGDPTGNSDLASLLDQAAAGRVEHVAFVAPASASWSLPLYELALGFRQRVARERLRITLVTPESAPLELLGQPASDVVRALLERRGIELVLGAHAHEHLDGRMILTPGERPLLADRIVALPELRGPATRGLPLDDHGFIQIDEYCAVADTPDVFAAGDGTTFPIKQGGLAAQQADAIAELLAARAGSDLVPAPFRPVLRGMLLCGSESISAVHDLSGGAGDGQVSSDRLWWPPEKIAGRFLGAWLAHTDPAVDLDPPGRPLTVEVSLPGEWHAMPMLSGEPV